MKKVFLSVLALSFGSALAQDRVAAFDRDGDARVSFAELSDRCEISRQLFNRADINSDGTLSNQELSRARRYLLITCQTEHKA